MPTPAAGAHMLELAGACVEPIVYVLLLWTLRERPLWFGALLAFGFLHREFTIFAVPALVLAEAGCRPLSWRAVVRHAGRAALGFAAVWLVVDDVRMHLSGEALALQASNLGNQTCFAPDELGMRIRAQGVLQRIRSGLVLAGLPANALDRPFNPDGSEKIPG